MMIVGVIVNSPEEGRAVVDKAWPEERARAWSPICDSYPILVYIKGIFYSWDTVNRHSAEKVLTYNDYFKIQVQVKPVSNVIRTIIF